ncbi:MAG: MotA/TolQ/ExbB proton channel family protein [Methyloglobulus sp.]|nr:MotA/TolQ/ExbB proton channel family protein [Methyloglobulus sp.]
MDFSETSIVNATLWLLAFFSLLTWSIILLKLGEWAFNAFRNNTFTKNVMAGGKSISYNLSNDGKSQFARLLQAGQNTINQIPGQISPKIDHHSAWHELAERAVQQQVRKEKAKMDSGLGWLASFGSVSPFVGLFGTVWGIMHALQEISQKGSASLEVVAGPIGEALIATAIGIAVAIPAVLAYNFFVRLNKSSLAKLEHFAEDYLRSVIQQHLQQQTGSAHGISNPK